MFKKIGRGLKKFFTNRLTQAVIMQAAAIAVPHVAAFLQTGWQRDAVEKVLQGIDFEHMDEYGDLADVKVAKTVARESILALLASQGFSERVSRIAVELALDQIRTGGGRQ